MLLAMREAEKAREEARLKAEKQKAQEQLDWILNRTKGIGSRLKLSTVALQVTFCPGSAKDWSQLL